MSVLAPLFPQLYAQMRATFGGNGLDEIGMDPLGFLMDSPLMSTLHFLGSSMPTAPEELVDDLLDKLHSSA